MKYREKGEWVCGRILADASGVYALRGDNQGEKAATIRMRMLRRGRIEGVPGMGTGLEVEVLYGASW